VRSHDVARCAHLLAGRYPGQGRPGGHGGQPGDARPHDRSQRLRFCATAAASLQGPRRTGQVVAARAAVPPCAARTGRSTQERIFGSARCVVTRTPERLGGRLTGSGALAAGWSFPRRAHIAEMAGAPGGNAGLEHASVEHIDDAGVARLPQGDDGGERRMKVLFFVSSLHAGGAERVASTLSSAWAQRGDAVTLVPTFTGKGHQFYPLDPAVRVVWLA